MLLRSNTILRLRQRVVSIANDNFKRTSSSLALEWKNAKSYQEIPSPTTFDMIKGLLPGGNLVEMNGFDFLKTLNLEHGNIAKIQGVLGQRDLVVLFDPNDIAKVYQHEGKYPKRRGLDCLEYFRETHRKDLFGKGGLLVAQGSGWLEFRNKVNHTMSQPQQYIEKIDEVVCELVTKMKQKRTAKGETSENFFDHLNEWALESIGLITFDKRLGLIRKPDSSRLNQLVKKVMRLCFEYDVMPSIWRVNQSANPGFQNTLSTFEALSRIVKDHVEDGRRKIEKMGKSSETTAFEKWIGIDRQVAFVMALDCIMSGVDPTTCGAVSILYALAKNPDKQAILREELLQILPEKCSNITAQSLENVPYVRAVVKEALRLHPPFNGNIRALDQNLVIKGYQIPKDTNLFLATNFTCFQEKYFKQSKRFLPERWLESNKDQKCPHASDSHPFAFLPFSQGPRSCIGRQFAELSLEVLTIRLMREFIFEWRQPFLKFKSYSFNVPADPLKFKITDTKA